MSHEEFRSERFGGIVNSLRYLKFSLNLKGLNGPLNGLIWLSRTWQSLAHHTRHCRAHTRERGGMGHAPVGGTYICTNTQIRFFILLTTCIFSHSHTKLGSVAFVQQYICVSFMQRYNFIFWYGLTRWGKLSIII